MSPFGADLKTFYWCVIASFGVKLDLIWSKSRSLRTGIEGPIKPRKVRFKHITLIRIILSVFAGTLPFGDELESLRTRIEASFKLLKAQTKVFVLIRDISSIFHRYAKLMKVV